MHGLHKKKFIRSIRSSVTTASRVRVIFHNVSLTGTRSTYRAWSCDKSTIVQLINVCTRGYKCLFKNTYEKSIGSEKSLLLYVAINKKPGRHEYSGYIVVNHSVSQFFNRQYFYFLPRLWIFGNIFLFDWLFNYVLDLYNDFIFN